MTRLLPLLVLMLAACGPAPAPTRTRPGRVHSIAERFATSSSTPPSSGTAWP